MPNLKKLFVDDHFQLTVEFIDGEIRQVNLKEWIDGNSRVKEDLAFCKRAYIENEHIISWPTGISIDPDFIYDKGTKITTLEGAEVTKASEKEAMGALESVMVEHAETMKKLKDN